MATTGGFDDHATVVALEFVVKRLVVRQCISASSPVDELADWKVALKNMSDLTTKFAFQGARNDEVTANAIQLAGEIDRIAEEIGDEFLEARGPG